MNTAADHPLDQATLPAALSALSRQLPAATATFPGMNVSLDAAGLDRASVRFARGLLRHGVRPKAVVGLAVPTSADFLVSLFGVLRVGAAVCPLPALQGLSGSSRTRLAHAVRAAGMRHLITDAVDPTAIGYLRESCPGLALLGADLGARGSGSLPEVAPDDLAIVQFTSGSTAEPKGVMLPHRAVLAGLRAIVLSGGLKPDDVLVQWVPPHHDMGLFGMLAALLNGGSAVLLSPMSFVRKPTGLLAEMARSRGTLMTGPDFSYRRLASAATPQTLAGLDLRRWRIAFNGAEPVRAATLTAFEERFAPAGVASSTMYPVYGMAEATLAITFPEPGSQPRVVHVDREVLGNEGAVRLRPPDHPGVKALVAVGKPVHGMRMRLVDKSGELCRPGRLGEVQISGPAVTTGYYRNPEANGEAFDGSWFRTGDLGFQLRGDLFVAGRSKEMIIIRGVNVFPEDIEAVASQVQGVHRGHCVAFPVTDHDGDERIAVAIEVARTGAPESTARRVRRAVCEALDINAVEVHTVAANSLPRTTSGKWQRALTRQRVSRSASAAAAREMAR
ncbi:AMP-binding protein [Streptomyces sp. NEAU-H22]|uniref:AMP-binding protein n=1 Tax=unclassified Streptomyces TaxID=2593676 RepID=UPI0022504242|nr:MULTISPECIES: AMP-binding protein [unclassified Streptomyces]MCX3290742.1 AMP-binding protein [Streptomyces sp. NEAU-H22]WMD04635.1 AMP-binding protein [Streptomyces sp. FXY-T5]